MKTRRRGEEKKRRSNLQGRAKKKKEGKVQGAREGEKEGVTPRRGAEGQGGLQKKEGRDIFRLRGGRRNRKEVKVCRRMV